jgi:hypothetical protein
LIKEDGKKGANQSGTKNPSEGPKTPFIQSSKKISDLAVDRNSFIKGASNRKEDLSPSSGI